MTPYAKNNPKYNDNDGDCAGLRASGAKSSDCRLSRNGNDVRAFNSQRNGGRAAVRTSLNKGARAALKCALRSEME